MTLAVDQLSLGQIGTNCYLVRADRPRPKRSSSTRAPRRPRSGSPGPNGCHVLRDPADAQPLRPHRRARRPRRGNGRAGLAAAGRARRLPPPERLLPRRLGSGVQGDATLLAGGETVEAAGISFQVLHVPGTLPGSRLVLRRRLPLLRRRPLRGLGRSHRSALRRLGDPGGVDPLDGRRLSARDDRLLRSRAADDPRRRARPQSVPRRAPRVSVQRPRGTHDILPSEQPLWQRVTWRDGASLRAVRLPAHPDARVRGHRALRAHLRARAPTSSRRRCTPSPTAPTGR